MRVFSGIQPTKGRPHLGNYLGTIRSWVRMSGSARQHDSSRSSCASPTSTLLKHDIDTKNNNILKVDSINDHRCVFSVVDLHAMTSLWSRRVGATLSTSKTPKSSSATTSDGGAPNQNNHDAGKTLWLNYC